jgi:large subunit ribosomal protein L21
MKKKNAKFAVIELKGTQYKVKEGDELLVDKLDKKELKPAVLLLVDGKNIKVGKPLLKSVNVRVKLLEEKVKGEKITISKYKAKSRYRRKYGFTPLYSRIKIEKITS